MVARVFQVLLLLAILVVLGAGLYHFQFQANPKAATNGRQKDSDRAQPVVVAKAVTKPMPRQFDTVGRVQTMASVAIRSRIDGVIEKVPVTEGQDVKKLAIRCSCSIRGNFRPILRQSEANLAKDRLSSIRPNASLPGWSRSPSAIMPPNPALDQQQANVSSLEASVASDDAAIESHARPDQLCDHHCADRRPHRQHRLQGRQLDQGE